MTVAFSRDSKQAIVANYLGDSVQVVDLVAGKLIRTVSLGAPSKPTVARKGEELFYDARLSHNQWFSCHTCHVDGHTCGQRFDTLNDESYGNPKMTPTLRNVTRTGPWTWHGWQKDLDASVAKSMKETLWGPEPRPQDVKALVAFLGTLDNPARPKSRIAASADVQRGKAIFEGKAGCMRCHHGEQYTAPRNYDVQLEEDGSPFTDWNPPSLRGLWDRGPYLHDGRADSLEELLRAPHAPEKLGGKALSSEERRQLIAFLLSLD
jgi:cytochrome c peroxidase